MNPYNYSDNEIFFITYEDVIKAPAIEVLRLILTKYSEYYKEYIDYDKMKNISTYEHYLRFFSKRTCKNILEYLALKPYNFNKAYNDIYNRDKKIINRSHELDFSLSLKVLLLQKFLTKIYIWTEKYDENIRLDIMGLYGKNEKVNYVSGNLNDCITQISDITCYVFNDIEYIGTVISCNKHKKVVFLIGNYEYNHTNKNNKHMLKIRNDRDVLDNQSNLFLFNPMSF